MNRNYSLISRKTGFRAIGEFHCYQERVYGGGITNLMDGRGKEHGSSVAKNGREKYASGIGRSEE